MLLIINANITLIINLCHKYLCSSFFFFTKKENCFFFLNSSDINLNSNTCVLTFTLYADCFMKIGSINSRRLNWKVIDAYYATNLEQLTNIFLSFSLFKI